MNVNAYIPYMQLQKFTKITLFFHCMAFAEYKSKIAAQPVSKLTLSAISDFCTDSLLQHIFDKYPIPSRRVIHQHMRHRANYLSILKYRAT